ncbi:MAG: GTP cyclohydrolase I FolE2 [Deltaproteobacteria bacterium]|nr:GTP cyclohydrolase I FolE2 [Deltaproteobacteria bacterium]MBF0510531.1 GTP cyclohydrolase I FolE2 [Deltaproteobacteria bacterium]
MCDVQSRKDDRNIEIDKVGVKDIHYPITVLDKQNGTQQTVATINMYVNLPHDHKGTHMSRFIEILGQYRREMTIHNFIHIMGEMKRRLKAQSAHLEVSFPYFIKKKAPVSGAEGLMEYMCSFKGSLGKEKEIIIELKAPISTLCPCSKEISRFGAHNQRGMIQVNLKCNKFIWIEDIIQMIESCASTEIYSVLKRTDEKYVTEKAYENPKFVEDVVRDAASLLDADENITWFSVEAENFESIHNHSAYAYIERDKLAVARCLSESKLATGNLEN